MLLYQCVSATNFQKNSKATTSKQVWDTLKVYDNSGKIKKVKLQSLRRQYELIAMNDQETISNYFNRLQVLLDLMWACDESVEDCKIVEKLLRTLTPQFDHIVIAIEESRDLEKMIVEELQNSLEVHEQRVLERKNSEKNIVEQALQARTSQNKNKSHDGLIKRSRGGRGGGRNKDSNSQDNDGSSTEQKDNHICRGGNQHCGRGRKNFDKRKISVTTVTSLVITLRSVGRVTIQTRKVRMMQHT